VTIGVTTSKTPQTRMLSKPSLRSILTCCHWYYFKAPVYTLFDYFYLIFQQSTGPINFLTGHGLS